MDTERPIGETAEARSAPDWHEVLAVLRRRCRLGLAVLFVVWGLVVTASFLQEPTYEAVLGLTVRVPALPGAALDVALSDLFRVGPRALEGEQWMLTNPLLLEEAAEQLGMTQPGEKIRGRVQANIVGANLIVLKVQDENAGRAADLANRIADRHVERGKARALARLEDTVTRTGRQVEQMEKQLARSEEAVRDYKASHLIVDLPAEVQGTVAMVSNLTAQATAAGVQKASASELADHYRRVLLTQDETYVASSTVARNPLVQDIETRLFALEGERAAETGLRPEHPTIKQLDEEIAATREALADAVSTVVSSQVEAVDPVYREAMVQLAAAEAEARAAQAREDALRARVEKETKHLADMPDLAADLGSLQRDADVASAVYVELVRRHETAKLQRGDALSPVEVLSPAQEPEEPVKPRKVLNAILGFIFGLAIAAMLMAVVELLSDPLRSEKDARSELGLPVFTCIRRASRREVLLTESAEAGASTFSDAFAALRTNLRVSTPEGIPPVLLVAGSAAGEGRTTVATNLAAVLAQGGANTLLLDGDMRSPQVHERLSVVAGDGLSDVLAGTCELADCVQETQWPNLSLLRAGATPANPVELLDSEQARAAFDALRERFAAIIVDSPPWPCPDVLLLASISDAVVFVLQTGKTGRQGASRLVEQLTNMGKRPLGMSIIEG